MQATDLAYLSIAEAARAIHAKEVSPVELTEATLSRIERLDPKLNAYLTLTPERALADARAAEARVQAGTAGPLTGIPIAHKDIYQTKGIRTTGGSALLDTWIPEEDATVVTRWAEAGTVMLGKLITHEFALGMQTPGHAYPPAKNPWNTERVPSGSSSGSGAALAAGLCYGATGSDTGGSIRGPAAFCGITGLKPTYGRVSKYGVLPLSWSLDHAGPMARSAEDCALLLQAMAGHDSKDPPSALEPVDDYTAHLNDGIKGLRIGVLQPPADNALDAPVAAAYAEAARVIESLGGVVADIEIPSLQLAGLNTLIMFAEAYAYHAADMKASFDKYGDIVQGRFLAGALFTGAEYVQAQRLRARLRADFAAVLSKVDLLIMPVANGVAPTFADSLSLAVRRLWSYMAPLNLTGLPALALPTGFSEENLPTSMQIVGRAFDEATVLRAGHAFQQATGWHKRRPPL